LIESFDRTAALWRVTDPRHPEPFAVLTGHTDRVDTVAFTPDGSTLITGAHDRTARLWNTDPDETRPSLRHRPTTSHRNRVEPVFPRIAPTSPLLKVGRIET
jgi:WD40 repeat protein